MASPSCSPISESPLLEPESNEFHELNDLDFLPDSGMQLSPYLGDTNDHSDEDLKPAPLRIRKSINPQCNNQQAVHQTGDMLQRLVRAGAGNDPARMAEATIKLRDIS